MENGLRIILLAEDNPADVYLLREALNTHGGEQVELTVASDGEEALDYVERRGRFFDARRPDLIVLDLNLPKSEGSDVLRCIRQRDDLLGIPVIILTSSDSPSDRSIVERLGADRFITKPSDLDEFLSLGGTLLDLLRKQPDSSTASA